MGHGAWGMGQGAGRWGRRQGIGLAATKPLEESGQPDSGEVGRRRGVVAIMDRMADRLPTCPATSGASPLRRGLLAAAGVLAVALGGIGAFVPGLPTTIFLIVASYCFARSCPWLEARLLRCRSSRPTCGSSTKAIPCPRGRASSP